MTWWTRCTSWFRASRLAHKQLWGNLVLLLGTLAYPFLVYFSLGHFEPRWLALLLVGLALIRLLAGRTMSSWAMVAITLPLAALAWLGNALMPIKLYPVAVNGLMLVLFSWTLLNPPSAIERLARLREPDLPGKAVVYTRQVTQVWCLFFVVNGGIALTTAYWGSEAAWALYNGLISYVLMGVLAAVEWLVRRRVRRSDV